MDLLKYLILGIIQGITEPIPVSSSGHLFVFKNLLNTDMFNDLNFEVFANFGSFLAILFIFRKDLIRLIKNFFTFIFSKKDDIKKKTKVDFKYCMYIIVGSIPIGIIGFLFKDTIEEYLNNIKIVGISFLLTSIALFIVSKFDGKRKEGDLNYLDAIVVGLVQVIAVIPGISRSGSTLVAALSRKMDRGTAIKYSFMLYIPVSIATMGLSLIDVIKEGNLSTILMPYLIGLVAAGIITYFSYNWLVRVVKKGNLWKFAIYCALLGLFTIFYF